MLSHEPVEISDRADPIEPTDRALPIEPIDKAEPTDPTDSTDPTEPIDNTESCDHSDSTEPEEAQPIDRSGVFVMRPSCPMVTLSRRSGRRPQVLTVRDDGRTVDVAASVGAATPEAMGTRPGGVAEGGRCRSVRRQALRPRGPRDAAARHRAVHQRSPGRTAGDRRVGTIRMSLATLPEDDWIRGISIRQPYGAFILAGGKTVENRPAQWRTGWVHTSKTIPPARPPVHPADRPHDPRPPAGHWRSSPGCVAPGTRRRPGAAPARAAHADCLKLTELTRDVLDATRPEDRIAVASALDDWFGDIPVTGIDDSDQGVVGYAPTWATVGARPLRRPALLRPEVRYGEATDGSLAARHLLPAVVAA
ncbi:hypothetical protein GCM10010350_74700 [Streptomyces galilaeus]|nr:hypothetical protein GCM10010350_74700 [Streptomyces galilaeus]